MARFSIPSVVLTLALIASGGCAPSPATSARPSPAPVKAQQAAKQQAQGVLVTGTVLAPSSIIAAGGGNVIAPGGGNVIAPGGGNVIAPGGANMIAPYRRVLAASEAPLVGAEVVLADAAGEPLPGIATVKTDAQGRYSFPGAPAGHTYVVVARARNKDGKAANMQTIVRATDLGATADMGAASTMVATAVLEGQGAELGEFNPATFKTAVEATRQELTDETMPDFSDRAALRASIEALSSRVEAIKSAVTEIKNELKLVEKALDALNQKIAEGPNGAPPALKPRKISAKAPFPAEAYPVTVEFVVRTGAVLRSIVLEKPDSTVDTQLPEGDFVEIRVKTAQDTEAVSKGFIVVLVDEPNVELPLPEGSSEKDPPTGWGQAPAGPGRLGGGLGLPGALPIATRRP